MRFVIAFVAACGAPATLAPPPTVPPKPVNEPAVAEPLPKQPHEIGRPGFAGIDPRDPAPLYRAGRRRDVTVLERERGQPREQDIAESDLWSACVKDYVQAQAAPARSAWKAAFARYGTSCDADRRIVIAAPAEVRGTSHLGIAGTITTARSELSLYASVCNGQETGGVDHLVIVYDGKRWTSGRLVVERRDGCDVLAVPNGRNTRRMLRDVIDATDAVVHFEGKASVPDDFAITADMKRDLAVLLDALESSTGP